MLVFLFFLLLFLPVFNSSGSKDYFKIDSCFAYQYQPQLPRFVPQAPFLQRVWTLIYICPTYLPTYTFIRSHHKKCPTLWRPKWRNTMTSTSAALTDLAVPPHESLTSRDRTPLYGSVSATPTKIWTCQTLWRLQWRNTMTSTLWR